MNHKYPPLSKTKISKKEKKMKNRKELYNELLELAKNNIPPLKEHLNISIDKSNMLADYYKANKDYSKI